MHWSTEFVGLPWMERGRTRAGIDCYGLLRLPFEEKKGLSLRSYDGEYLSTSERDEIAVLLGGGTAIPPWVPVNDGTDPESLRGALRSKERRAWAERCGALAREFDMIVFQRAGIDAHVGLVVDRGRMLHISETTESRIERFDTDRWLPRFAGLYRHMDLA